MPPNCTCRVCGRAFYRGPAQLARGAGTYCSIACRSEGLSADLHQPQTHVERTCERCGKTFTVDRSRLGNPGRKGHGRFCSWECRKAPKDEVVKRVDAMGYVAIRIDGEWTHEHRVVAEQMLGRPLTSHEAVHHKGGDRTNNDPSNLEVMTRSEHQWRHHRERFPLSVGQWGPGRECCAQCGTTGIPHKGKGLCVSCYSRQRTLEKNPNAELRAKRRKATE